MFTKKELQIICDALIQYNGLYGEDYKNKKLTIKEIKYHKESLKIQDKLINRIQELLMDLD